MLPPDLFDAVKGSRSPARLAVPQAVAPCANAAVSERKGLEPPLGRAFGGEQVVLGPDPQSAAAARDFLRCTCLQWGLEATLEAALLVVSELVTNAVVHARSQVTVRLRLRSDHLLVEVEDEDDRLPVLHKHTDWEALGGRGLTLIDALSARWGSQPCPFGKIVWAELPLVADPSVRSRAQST